MEEWSEPKAEDFPLTAGQHARTIVNAIEYADPYNVRIPLFEEVVDEEAGTFWFRDDIGTRWKVTLTKIED